MFQIEWKWRDVAKYGDPYSELLHCILPIQSALTFLNFEAHLLHNPIRVGRNKNRIRT